MSFTQFSRSHPVAYQRMLVGSLAMMLTWGIASTLSAHHTSKGYSFGELTLPLPAASVATVAAKVPVSPARLTSLPGSDGSASPTTATVVAAAAIPAGGDLRQLGRTLNAIQFGDGYWNDLNLLWTRESNWNPNARSYSGACGIPQALPCAKMGSVTAAGQIQWGLNYIQRRYGNPAGAWQHELAFGWY